MDIVSTEDMVNIYLEVHAYMFTWRSLLQTQDCKGDDKSFVNVAHFSLFLIRTPLHCAASCNNVQVCKFLVESGAAVFATTYSDLQTAADKCEEMEEGYIQCSQFLYGMCMSIQ